MLLPLLLLFALLLLLLAQLEDPRQHLQARDFFPADVSELSSVEAVELCCCGTGFGVGVEVIVIVGGCRQHVVAAAEVDFGFVAAGTTFAVVVVVVDSFLEPAEKVKPLNHFIRILCVFLFLSQFTIRSPRELLPN